MWSPLTQRSDRGLYNQQVMLSNHVLMESVVAVHSAGNSLFLPLIWARWNGLRASHYNGNFGGRHSNAALFFSCTVLQQEPSFISALKDAAANNSHITCAVKHSEMQPTPTRTHTCYKHVAIRENTVVFAEASKVFCETPLGCVYF